MGNESWKYAAASLVSHKCAQEKSLTESNSTFTKRQRRPTTSNDIEHSFHTFLPVAAHSELIWIVTGHPWFWWRPSATRLRYKTYNKETSVRHSINDHGQRGFESKVFRAINDIMRVIMHALRLKNGVCSDLNRLRAMRNPQRSREMLSRQN